MMFSKLASHTIEPRPEVEVVAAFLSHDVITVAIAAAAVMAMMELLIMFIVIL
jgi:hypothetical protein